MNREKNTVPVHVQNITSTVERERLTPVIFKKDNMFFQNDWNVIRQC